MKQNNPKPTMVVIRGGGGRGDLPVPQLKQSREHRKHIIEQRKNFEQSNK